MSAKLIKVVGLLCTFALQNDINKLIMHTRKEQMEAFGRFLDILDELREKCPWDRKQTNESLRPNTIEETYELCDALMKDDKKDICKELGDVLLHVAFYAKIGSETGDFDIKDVCSCLFKSFCSCSTCLHFWHGYFLLNPACIYSYLNILNS